MPHRPFRSLESARRQFMAAGRNEEIIEGVLGRLDCKTSNIFDCLEYRRRPARTWPEAFAACATGRTWATFNLTALRELHEDFKGLDLPAEVYEAQASAAERAWIAGMAELDGYADEEQAAWYEYGGIEADDATWDQEILEGLLAMTGEQAVDESMIVEESAAPLVCIDGGRRSGRASDAFVARMLAGADVRQDVDGAMFGIEIEPLGAMAPRLPAWAWR